MLFVVLGLLPNVYWLA